MTVALLCSRLSKSLGRRKIIQALDLSVETGEVVSLLGASGSGKTTLLRLVAGLLDPDEGAIEIAGRKVWVDGLYVPAERRGIGMVFQDYALWPHMSVSQNLSFGLEAQRVPQQEIGRRLKRALEATQLGEFRDRYPSELSGGQQQRVAIARCLVTRPSLMLFDEPLSNLDAALREDIRQEMMDVVTREGITALYVTHDQSEAMAVSHRIAVMRGGVIAQLDTPEAIYDHPANAFVASFIGGFSLVKGANRQGSFFPSGSDRAIPTNSSFDGEGLLIIRPEDARPAATFPASRLSGRVVSRAFQGRCWRLVVALGDQPIRLDWSQPGELGESLEFSLPPERCVVLPNQ